MKKVFISHPFKEDPEKNRARVDKICKSIKDHLPISPLHLFAFMESDGERDTIMEVCFRLIDISDEVWIYGDSEGCRIEKEHAMQTGKIIREGKYAGDNL